MTINNYITLKNSNESTIKKFRVTPKGYKPAIIKPGRIDTTVDGTLDVQVGPVTYQWQYVLRVYTIDPTDADESDAKTAGFGTLAHLKELFELDDPAATPSNALKFTEHDDSVSEHNPVYLMGSLVTNALGPDLTGVNAVFEIPVMIVKG